MEPYLDIIREKWFDQLIRDDCSSIHERFASFTPFTLSELLEYGTPLRRWKFVATLRNILSGQVHTIERQNVKHKIIFYFFQIGVFPRDVFLRSHFTEIDRIYIENNHNIMVYINRNEYPLYWRDFVDNSPTFPSFNNSKEKSKLLQQFSQACRFAITVDIQRWRDENKGHKKRCNFCNNTEREGIKLEVDHKYAFKHILKDFIQKEYISNPNPQIPFPTSLQPVTQRFSSYRFKLENKAFEDKWIKFHRSYKNNLQWLCRHCNRSKSDTGDTPETRARIREKTMDRKLANASAPPVRRREDFLQIPRPNGNISMASSPTDPSVNNEGFLHNLSDILSNNNSTSTQHDNENSNSIHDILMTYYKPSCKQHKKKKRPVKNKGFFASNSMKKTSP